MHSLREVYRGALTPEPRHRRLISLKLFASETSFPAANLLIVRGSETVPVYPKLRHEGSRLARRHACVYAAIAFITRGSIGIASMDAEEYNFTGEALGYSRKVWIAGSHSPPSSQRQICLFLDAEFYLNRLEATEILDALSADGAITPAVGVFVSNQSVEDRHFDYACNSQYGGFIAVDLMDWINDLLPNTSHSGNLIVGLSLSGLAAAHIALTHRNRFSKAICQSGSFWWNGEWFAKNALALSSAKGRFWLSVGDQETESGVVHGPTGLRQDVSQIAGCERAARTLQSAGHKVHLNRFAGGHDTTAWKADLPLALKWSVETPDY
jgi:enterochelin esterase-like enzyme